MWRCFKWLMFLHFCVEFPAMFLTHPMLSYLGIRSDLPLPLWCARPARRAPHSSRRRTVIGQCVAFFIIEDFYFYWIHRFLHWDAIYQCGPDPLLCASRVHFG